MYSVTFCVFVFSDKCKAVNISDTSQPSSVPPGSSPDSSGKYPDLHSTTNTPDRGSHSQSYFPSTDTSSKPSSISSSSSSDHTASSPKTTTSSHFETFPDITTLSSGANAFRKHWATIVTFLVFACVFSVGVFFLIFGLLQARSSEQLCWSSHRYEPVPTLYRNGTGKVRITDVEYTDDENDLTEEESLYQRV